MRQQLIDLNEIQKIDLEIREIEKSRTDSTDGLRKHEAKIAEVKGELRTLVEQREVMMRETKTLEGTVHAESLKIKKWEIRLNDIRNQREYLALSREVEGGKRANRDADEKILELMTQREELDKKIEALSDKLAEEEVDYDSAKAAADKATREVQEHLNGLTKRRNGLAGKIPKPLFKKYEMVRQKRFGVGLVTVADGCCQGCNMKLPPQLYNILQRGDSIEQCPSCHRIIYWEPNGTADKPAGKGAEASP
ncbi:MAG: hypothetical protein HYZ27_09280 [Deltaproteobacteria bacterium]|nr:hypothetical protein [Deltaproteobacteria bacterium]